MYNIERKSEIMKLLEQNGRVDVNDLALFFDSSRETIRRDLREMELDGLLKRTHGGAVFEKSNLTGVAELPVVVREIQRIREKTAICKVAAAFINNGDTIFVDNSSTCLYLLQFIPFDYQITLITNSIKLMVGTVESRHINMMTICLGGIFHGSNLSTYGNISLKNAANYYPNKSFMSCAGIHLPDQLTDSSILEVDTKRLMIEQSKEVFILADYTKFDQSGQVFLSNFSNIDTLITDRNANPAAFIPLQQAGVKVIQSE